MSEPLYGYEFCPECGQTFPKYQAHQKFCDSLCGRRYRNKKYKRQEKARERRRKLKRKSLHEQLLYLKQCDQCLEWFISHQPQAKRCSKHCRAKADKKSKQLYYLRMKEEKVEGKKTGMDFEPPVHFPESAHYWIPAGDMTAAEGLATPAI